MNCKFFHVARLGVLAAGITFSLTAFAARENDLYPSERKKLDSFLVRDIIGAKQESVSVNRIAAALTQRKRTSQETKAFFAKNANQRVDVAAFAEALTQSGFIPSENVAGVYPLRQKLLSSPAQQTRFLDRILSLVPNLSTPESSAQNDHVIASEIITKMKRELARKKLTLVFSEKGTTPEDPYATPSALASLLLPPALNTRVQSALREARVARGYDSALETLQRAARLIIDEPTVASRAKYLWVEVLAVAGYGRQGDDKAVSCKLPGKTAGVRMSITACNRGNGAVERCMAPSEPMTSLRPTSWLPIFAARAADGDSPLFNFKTNLSAVENQLRQTCLDSGISRRNYRPDKFDCDDFSYHTQHYLSDIEKREPNRLPKNAKASVTTSKIWRHAFIAVRYAEGDKEKTVYVEPQSCRIYERVPSDVEIFTDAEKYELYFKFETQREQAQWRRLLRGIESDFYFNNSACNSNATPPLMCTLGAPYCYINVYGDYTDRAGPTCHSEVPDDDDIIPLP